MDKKTIIISIAVLCSLALIIVILIVKNSHKNNLKNKINGLYVRFNALKTIPIAFKFNKAQIMAKGNEDTKKAVQEYFEKYEIAEKHISEVQDALNNVDDEVGSSSYSKLMQKLNEVESSITSCEDEISVIDKFLDDFSKKDDEQREYSASLKEKYRVVKNTINDNANLLSISYDGIVERLEKCEDLFSSSEEWMYASEYEKAQTDLDKINEILEQIKVNANAIPKCIKDTKGVLPVMLDETRREFALTKQRGVFVDHLLIEDKLKTIDDNLNEDLKKLASGNTDGVRNHCHESKKVLNELNEALAAENRSFKEAKETNEKVFEHINDLVKVEEYVRVAYEKDSQRFGLQDLKPILKLVRDNTEKYQARYKEINEILVSCVKPASEILVEVERLGDDVEKDKKELYTYKTVIDKSTDGESRATTQLTKLQLVVSEVETKIAEYHLPTISETYSDDLNKSREMIDHLRELTNEVPINIDELNTVLDESIDFIYTFYNNVNNVVGMAIMVENAIMFGNKYRSSFPEIDRELSKAEFQYLNGEYTKALKTAIACMETLFPDNADEKILENA